MSFFLLAARFGRAAGGLAIAGVAGGVTVAGVAATVSDGLALAASAGVLAVGDGAVAVGMGATVLADRDRAGSRSISISSLNKSRNPCFFRRCDAEVTMGA